MSLSTRFKQLRQRQRLTGDPGSHRRRHGVPFKVNNLASDGTRLLLSASLSDDDAAGTALLRHSVGGLPGSSLVAAGSHLFFAADDRDTGEELWALDIP